MANTSFITDSTELFYYLEKQHVYELLTQSESEVVAISQALTTDQSARLEAAMNWGAEQINAILRERYAMDGVTYTNAPVTLKLYNARLTQWMLEKRRYRSAEAMTDDINVILEELREFAREGSVANLGITDRSDSFAVDYDSKATQFDNVGQFDAHIPDREDDDVWPDGKNE